MTLNLKLSCDYVSEITTTIDNQVSVSLENVDAQFIKDLETEQIIQHQEPKDLLEEISSVYGKDYIKDYIKGLTDV